LLIRDINLGLIGITAAHREKTERGERERERENFG